MKKITSLLLLFVAFATQAQDSNKFFIETEYQLKFSVGQPSYQSFQLIKNLQVDLPYVATYGYPVNSLNLSFNYTFFKRFSAGLGFGFGFVKFEPVPQNASSYYDKLLVPMYARVRYTLPFKENWFALAEVDAGYQYTSNRWDYIKGAGDFKVQENGGAMFGATIGFGKTLKRYSPMLKVGYEFNQFSRQYVYTFTDNWLPTEYQSVNIYTYYHLVKVAICVKF